jgi:hypothetical protein
MKEFFKQSFYFLFKLLTSFKTERFSNFFAGLAYVIKSEHVYNHSEALAFNKGRLPYHRLLATGYAKPDEAIDFLEFGVMRGNSFAEWVDANKNPSSRFVGFDTFTGLPEDWGNVKKGSYSAGGKLPDIQDSRVKFCVGLIQDTLPGFVKELSKGRRKVIHIDVDLYNASLITLIHMQPLLEKGDIIIFDEFFSITKANHEFRAFLDFLSLYKFEYKPLVKARLGHYAVEIV